MTSYFNLRIHAPTGDRMKPYAAALGWSPNRFAERCIAVLCDMIEQPSKRTLPDIVAMLDAVRAAGSLRLPGLGAPAAPAPRAAFPRKRQTPPTPPASAGR